jgi:hypothetical protein
MLPGFRFLFAAIVLSMSVLIFGLGAAALLRSAHEEFASLPSRRAPAEQVFTRPSDPPVPTTLALLRFDPPVLDNKPPENSPAAAASEPVTPAEPVADAASAEPEKLAALKPEEPMPVAAAKPEIPAEDTTASTPVMPAEATPPIVTEEVKVAAMAETPEPAPTAAAPATDRPSLEGNLAATKIATLGGPAVTIEEKTAASTSEEAKADRSAARKRNAQRARERRRVAARRARLAAARHAAATAAQQQANPFGQTAATRTP